MPFEDAVIQDHTGTRRRKHLHKLGGCWQWLMGHIITGPGKGRETELSRELRSQAAASLGLEPADASWRNPQVSAFVAGLMCGSQEALEHVVELGQCEFDRLCDNGEPHFQRQRERWENTEGDTDNEA